MRRISVRRLSVLVGLMGTFVFISIGDSVSGQGSGLCGIQLNQAPVVFCDTFDTARPDSTTRTGDLDENVWGVSRTVGQQNGPNPWPTSKHGGCDQMTTASPPNDVRICNGRLINVVNDAHNVSVLAMYPKQPFDWNGRTGTVSFDVTNDSQGDHAAWPEFWITDLPIPTPFAHFGSWSANPRHGIGIRFASVAKPGDVRYVTIHRRLILAVHRRQRDHHSRLCLRRYGGVWTRVDALQSSAEGDTASVREADDEAAVVGRSDRAGQSHRDSGGTEPDRGVGVGRRIDQPETYRGHQQCEPIAVSRLGLAGRCALQRE